MPVASCIPFPFFFFFCSAQFYAYHACLCHSLAFYASLHACLHVHPWVLFASVSSMLQYNEVIDVQSKPTFFPRGHQLLFSFCLFAFLLVYLISGFFACHVYHAYLICFMSPLYAFCIFSFHRLFAGFLSIAFPCTHLEQGCMELGHDLPGTREKGKGASMLFEPSDGNQ